MDYNENGKRWLPGVDIRSGIHGPYRRERNEGAMWIVAALAAIAGAATTVWLMGVA